MYSQNNLEDNLIAIACYGDHYKLTNTLNMLDQNDFQTISETTYDLIISDLLCDHAHKGAHSVYSALHVFFAVTKPFLPKHTKERTRKTLDAFYKANCQ